MPPTDLHGGNAAAQIRARSSVNPEFGNHLLSGSSRPTYRTSTSTTGKWGNRVRRDPTPSQQMHQFSSSIVSLDLGPSSITSPTMSMSMATATSPPVSLRFPRPLLLPPRLPLPSSSDVSPGAGGMPRTEVIFIVCVVAFGLSVVLVAIIAGRMFRKRKCSDRLALSSIWNPKGRNGPMTVKSTVSASVIPPGHHASNISISDQSSCDKSQNIRKEGSLYESEDSISSSSSMLHAEAAVYTSMVSLQEMQKEFDERCHEEEADIALALQFALREQSCPVIFTDRGDQPTSPFFTPFEVDDMFAKLSLRAGIESAGKRLGFVKNRLTHDLEDQFEASSDTGSCNSTSTEDEDSEVDKDNDSNDPFELKTALARSMEIKKGMLMSWRSCDSLTKAEMEISKMPTVIVSGPSPIINSPYFSESLSSLSSSSSSINGFLRPPLPSLVITSPSISSLTSVPSSTSTMSIDLNDFPIPPPPLDHAAGSISTKIDSSPLFQEHDFETWNVDPAKASPGEERRSTLIQLLMMYTNA